jgi:diacylglycerol O-acyltransferase
MTPETAPGGTLTLEAVRDLVAERIHLLPPFRWRLAEVPLGLDLPYWVDDENFDLEFHTASWRCRRLATTASSPSRWRASMPARSTARDRCGSST